jgi:iron complex outermembrane receptor protein
MKQILKSTFLIGAILFPLFLSAQDNTIINATVSGKVLDARNDEALIGATVSIKGTTNGASTDANGEFSYGGIRFTMKNVSAGGEVND